MFSFLPSSLLLFLPLLPSITCQSSSSSGTMPLTLPSMVSINLTASTGMIFSLPSSSSRTYISLNLCSFPSQLSLNQTLPSPSLYVSNYTNIDQPGPDSNIASSSRDSSVKAGTALNPRHIKELYGGYANVTIESSTEGLWIGVWAPTIAGDDSTTVWNFELGVSTTGFVSEVDEFPSLVFLDSDSSSALFRTSASYNTSTLSSPPVSMLYPPLLFPSNSLSPALSRSICAIQALNASQPENFNTTSYLTTRGYGGGGRVEWLVQGLQGGVNYTVWDVDLSKQQSGEGGRVGGQLFFTTKSTSSCVLPPPDSLISQNCPSVSYAIPSPPDLPISTLADFYLPAINSSLSAFQTTLTTFPCNSSESTYSFISSCDDCYNAYQDWVCSVVMPRCTDYPVQQFANNFNSTYYIPPSILEVYPRAVAQGSRTPFFDQDILSQNQSLAPTGLTLETPFPYGEVLPCDSVCQVVGARCPPFLGWGCPLSGITRAGSYGDFQYVNQPSLQSSEGGTRSGNGLRSADRFGNVFCNAVGTDIQLAVQIGASTSLRTSLRYVSITFAFSLLGTMI